MTVRTADRTLDIFESFARRQRPITVSDLARELSLPTSTCFALVRTLVDRGFLYYLRPRGAFYPTRRLSQVADAIAHHDPIAQNIRPLLEGTGTRPLVDTRELAADRSVTIPPGVAHGFLALEQLELVYLVSNEFDGTDELGFAWDDPAVDVPWPTLVVTDDGRPITSERDAANPSLADLLVRIRNAPD